jgi:hypothetical protein
VLPTSVATARSATVTPAEASSAGIAGRWWNGESPCTHPGIRSTGPSSITATAPTSGSQASALKRGSSPWTSRAKALRTSTAGAKATAGATYSSTAPPSPVTSA